MIYYSAAFSEEFSILSEFSSSLHLHLFSSFLWSLHLLSSFFTSSLHLSPSFLSCFLWPFLSSLHFFLSSFSFFFSSFSFFLQGLLEVSSTSSFDDPLEVFLHLSSVLFSSGDVVYFSFFSYLFYEGASILALLPSAGLVLNVCA